MVILGLKTGYLRVTHPFAMVSKLTIRLACIRHAASVKPEPGSNSPKKFIFVCFYFSFLLILLKELLVCNSCSSYIVFKDLATLYNSALVYFITLKFNVNNYFIIFI